MSLIKKFFQNTAKPEGFLGRIMVSGMNSGHSKVALWGFSQWKTDYDDDILDIGCGGGANIGVWLKRTEGKVTGVDYSDVSVEKSKKLNAEDVKAGRCKVIHANVMSLPFEDESFNCASAFETVYFWPDLAEAFTEVFRVLKPGGRFFICNEADGLNEADLKWVGMIDGMRIYNEEELRFYLEKAGFSDISVVHDKPNHRIAIEAKK